MDTAAYLHSQGWAGHGHALHHSGRGITKPLAVNQKNNVLGIGKKKHDAHADQWWARAFDETLKGINTTKDVNTGATQSVQLGSGAQALQMAGRGGARWGGGKGLYGHFVRGESLGGTLTPEEGTSTPTSRGENEVKLEEPDDDVIEAVPKEKRKKSKRRKHREVEASTPGEASAGDHVPVRGLDGAREEAERAVLKERRKSKKRKQRDAEAVAVAEAAEIAIATAPIQVCGFTPINTGQDPAKVEQVKSPQRQKFWESILGPASTPEDTQPAQRLNEPIEKPKSLRDPEKKEKRHRQKNKTQRQILDEKLAKANRVREKKIIDPELRKARIARKNDRHKAIRTKQMIEDDRESYRKLWRGEVPMLDRGKKKNWQFCTSFTVGGG
jgi:nucleolar protein TMA23